MFKKSQTATEYMIILAVVLIISFIVVSSLGGIPSIGIGIGNRVSEAELRSGKIGITSYAITEDKTTATIQNNERETVTINSFNLKGVNCNIGTITLAPGQSRTIECNNFNSSLGTSFGNDVPVQVSYTTSAGAVFNQEYGDYKPPWCDSVYGTIIDGLEDVCWLKETESDTYHQWLEANEYCEDLTTGGLQWELASKEDWEYVFDNVCSSFPCANELNGDYGFDELVGGWFYWTSTPWDPPDPNSAWLVGLYNGYVDSGGLTGFNGVVCDSRY